MLLGFGWLLWGVVVFAAPSDVFSVESNNDWNLIENSALLVNVLFFRTDCSYCQVFVPEFSKAASSLRGLVQFAAIERKQQDELVNRIMRKYQVFF